MSKTIEFIEKEIKSTQNWLEYLYFIKNDEDIENDVDFENFTNFYNENKEKLKTLQQIKEELEVMELIKNGWSSMATTLNGEHIMRFQNLTIDDWVKLWNKLEEILLKKALEVNNATKSKAMV